MLCTYSLCTHLRSGLVDYQLFRDSNSLTIGLSVSCICRRVSAKILIFSVNTVTQDQGRMMPLPFWRALRGLKFQSTKTFSTFTRQKIAHLVLKRWKMANAFPCSYTITIMYYLNKYVFYVFLSNFRKFLKIVKVCCKAPPQVQRDVQVQVP